MQFEVVKQKRSQVGIGEVSEHLFYGFEDKHGKGFILKIRDQWNALYFDSILNGISDSDVSLAELIQDLLDDEYRVYQFHGHEELFRWGVLNEP